MIPFACRYTQKNLTAYVNGELDRSLREAIARHLSVCPKCRTSYETEKRLNRWLEAALPLAPAPEGLREKMMAAIVREAREGRRDMSWGEVSICALSLSLLLFFVIIWLDGEAVYYTLMEWVDFLGRLGSSVSEWEMGDRMVLSLSSLWNNAIKMVQGMWNQPYAGIAFLIMLFGFSAAGYQWLRLSKMMT